MFFSDQNMKEKILYKFYIKVNMTAMTANRQLSEFIIFFCRFHCDKNVFESHVPFDKTVACVRRKLKTTDICTNKIEFPIDKLCSGFLTIN